jgi:DNA-binding CsgD family transcriptional regulator
MSLIVGEQPLLERDAELRVLEATVAEAQASAGRLVVLEGPAGVGKTRLLAGARAIAERRGCQVLSARAGEFEQDFSFGVVRQLFEPALHLATAEERERALAGAAALAAALFDDVPGRGEPDRDRLFPMLHGLLWLTVNLSSAAPLAILVDDVHWADVPSLRFLGYLSRRIDGLPVAVVCTHRVEEPGADPALVAELVADPGAVVLRPSQLSPPAACAMLRELVSADAEDAFCRACHAAVGGNPLLLRELAYRLVADRVEPVAASIPLVEELAPRAVSRSLLLRLGRLPAAAVVLARAAAVLGPDALVGEALEVAGVAAEEASGALVDLVRAGILADTAGLAFAHPVVRAAVYNDVPPTERSRVHREAAGLLVRRGAVPERAASHLVAVAPAADGFVVDTLRAAARRSLDAGASDAAVRYLRRALDEPPAAGLRAEVVRELGLAERRVDGRAAVEHLGEALAATADAQLRAETALEHARALWHVDREEEAVEVLERAIDELGEAGGDLGERLRAELIGSALWQPELLPRAERHIEAIDVDALAGGVGAELLLAWAAHYEARLGRDRGRAIALARRALASGRLEAEGSTGVYYAAIVLLLAGRRRDAAGAIESALAAARTRGDLFATAGGLMYRGLAAGMTGDLRHAEDALREALELPVLYGTMQARPTGMLIEVLVERDELEEARALAASYEPPEGPPSRGHLFSLLLGRGRLRRAEGRLEDALADFRALGRLATDLRSRNPAHMPWRGEAASALLLLGRMEEARDLAAEELELAQRWGAPATIGNAQRLLGMATGGHGGEALLRDAVDTLADAESPLDLARALVELGAALRRANRRADARELLTEGHRLATASGAAALARRAAVEVAATGARARSLVVSGADALTASERRVAELAAAGRTNREIAQLLFVTPKTVEVHLSSAYRKLDIGSRGELPSHVAPARV